MKRKYLFSLLSGVILQLSLCWVRTYHDVGLSSCIESVSCFALLMYWLDKLESKQTKQTACIVFSVMAGYLLIAVPVFFIDVQTLQNTAVHFLIVISACVGAGIYYHSRRYTVLLLLMVMWILLNSVCLHAYINYLHELRAQ